MASKLNEILEDSTPELVDSVEPESEFNWYDLQKKFDAITNTDLIFYYLRDIIDILHICNNATCEIFPELHAIDIMRMRFTLYKTPASAESGIRNKQDLAKWQNDFTKYIIECKRVFSRIYALKTSKDTKAQESALKHKRFMEVVKEFNRNKNPIPTDFTKALQDNIDEYAETLNPNDERVLNAKAKLKKDMKGGK